MKASSDILHTAINNGHFHQVRFLVDKGADVNETDNSGRTPLILCSLVTDERWSLGLARLLIENGARISKCDQQGFNALHHACVNQRDGLVEVYLAALDCDVHSKCKKGNTCLHYAASLGNRVIVKSLAELVIKYKLTLDPKNKRGLTPLHQALKANQVGCGDLLMEFGANSRVLDSNRKSAIQLRQEAMERLHILALRETSKRPTSRIIRQIKQEAESERPKQDSKEIKLARDHDLRNDPEYAFNISAVNYFHEKDTRRVMNRPKTCAVTEQRPTRKSAVWKDEIMDLWHHYETRFSDSFRSPAISLPSTPEFKWQSESPVGGATPGLQSRKASRVSAPKSRTGSMTLEGPGSRRSSVTARRNGMPPLVRTQTRSNLGTS